MTAEIIQFGRPQSSSAKFMSVGQKSVQRRVRPEAEPEIEAVRCTVDGKFYEVVFRGESVCKVSTVHHRHRMRDGHIETIRNRKWTADGCSHRELDPAIVEAATRARGRSSAETNLEGAIAQLRERHARLLRQADKVEATIAILQRGMN